MKKFTDALFIFLASLFVSTNLLAQDLPLEWTHHIGGPGDAGAVFICQDGQGYIYTLSHFEEEADFISDIGVVNTTAEGHQDIFIQKMDDSGLVLWSKQLGNNLSFIEAFITADDAGNVFVFGEFTMSIDVDPGPAVHNFTTAGSRNMFLLKLDTNGDFLWAKHFEGTSFADVQRVLVDDLENIYLSGRFSGSFDFDPGAGVHLLTSSGAKDGFTLKLDQNGELLWASQIASVLEIYVGGIFVDNQGNVFTAGRFESAADFDPGVAVQNLAAPNDKAFFLQKLDANGNYIWATCSETPSFPGNTYASDILVDEMTGSIYLLCPFSGTVDFDAGPNSAALTSSYYPTTGQPSSDIALLKLNSLGDFEWVKQIGGVWDEAANKLKQDQYGDLYISGYFAGECDFDPDTNVELLSPFSSHDAFLAKYSAVGEYKWVVQFRSGQIQRPADVLIEDDLGIYYSSAFRGSVDVDPDPQANVILQSAGDVDAFLIKLQPKPTAIEDAVEFTTYSIYPNPSSGILNIEGTFSSHARLELFDCAGRQVLSLQLSEENSTVNIEALPAGVYQMLIHDDGAATAHLIVKD